MRPLIACFLLVLLLPAGCHSGPAAPAQQVSSQHFKVYQLRGKVVSADAAKDQVTVSHEAIPGFMEAMTMPYKLKNPGDMITADVLVSPDPDADFLLDDIVVVAQARPDH
jgi:protein SCO1/2